MQTELDILRDIATKLASAEIPYMLTGSVAMSYYAQPRMTRDIDVVVALRPGDAETIVRMLEQDYYLIPEAVIEAVSNGVSFNAIHFESIVKVDFILLPDTPYGHEKFGRRQQMAAGDFHFTIISREDLILSKLLWDKDSESEVQLRDVRNLLNGNCDMNYFRSWAVRLDVAALLEKLPDTPERAQKELTLHITLGVPLMTIKGYGASEVEQSYTRARELSQRLGESPRVFLVVAGLWAYYMIRAELKTARELAEQCMRLAQKVPTFLVQAHWMLENTLLHLGELVLAREYSEKGIAFYDPKHHRSYTSRYGHDLNVARLSHSARILWLLGYPDQALKRVEEAMSFAEKLSHRPSEAFALFLASYIHECRGEWAMAEVRGWPDNPTHLDVLAWAWHDGVPHHVIAVNLSAHPSQARIVLPWPQLHGRSWRLVDLLDGRAFERDGDELAGPGLYVDLPAWGAHLLAVVPAARS